MTRFGGRVVENGSGRIRRGADFCGDMWPRFRESVDPVFTSGEFPHRWSVVGKNGILTHGRGQQRGKGIMNLRLTQIEAPCNEYLIQR